MPHTSIRPVSGWRRPITHSRVVVFPEPFGPSSPKISPSATSKLTPCAASTSSYLFCRSWTITLGMTILQNTTPPAFSRRARRDLAQRRRGLRPESAEDVTRTPRVRRGRRNDRVHPDVDRRVGPVVPAFSAFSADPRPMLGGLCARSSASRREIPGGLRARLPLPPVDDRLSQIEPEG